MATTARIKFTSEARLNELFPLAIQSRHVFIFLNLFDLLELLVMLMTNTRNKILTAKLLRQGYRYHKLRKTFSKFYRRPFDIVSK